MPFRYRLIDEAGNDLGPLASRRSSWAAGERVTRRHGEQFVVLRVVDVSEEEGFHGFIVVRQA